MKDYKDLAKWLEEQGYTIERSYRGNHPRLLRPNGTFLMPWSESGQWRNIKNTISILRRQGIEVPR